LGLAPVSKDRQRAIASSRVGATPRHTAPLSETLACQYPLPIFSKVIPAIVPTIVCLNGCSGFARGGVMDSCNQRLNISSLPGRGLVVIVGRQDAVGFVSGWRWL